MFADDKSTVTTLEEIVSASTCSEYAFSLVSPSTSSFALGDAVPRPTLLLEVVIAVPTCKLVAVTIPALIFASVRSAFAAVRIPVTLISDTVVRPVNLDNPLTTKSSPVPAGSPSSKLYPGTDVPIPMNERSVL